MIDILKLFIIVVVVVVVLVLVLVIIITIIIIINFCLQSIDRLKGHPLQRELLAGSNSKDLIRDWSVDA